MPLLKWPQTGGPYRTVGQIQQKCWGNRLVTPKVSLMGIFSSHRNKHRNYTGWPLLLLKGIPQKQWRYVVLVVWPSWMEMGCPCLSRIDGTTYREPLQLLGDTTVSSAFPFKSNDFSEICPVAGEDFSDVHRCWWWLWPVWPDLSPCTMPQWWRMRSKCQSWNPASRSVQDDLGATSTSSRCKASSVSPAYTDGAGPNTARTRPILHCRWLAFH